MHVLTDMALVLAVVLAYKWLSLRYFQHRSNVYNALSFLVLLIVLSLTYFDLSPEALGLVISTKGLLYGAAASVVLIAGLFIGSRLKLTRTGFQDNRTAALSWRQLVKKAALDIPLGTVLTEELIFRGVIFALIAQASTDWSAVVYSSVAFGAWHIVDSVIFSRHNSAFGGKATTAIATVAFTTLAGIAFATLRLLSGSLLAPVLLHISSNSGALLISWLVNKNLRHTKR